MTHAEIRALLARCDPRQLREEAGISPFTIQRAFGISRFHLAVWERCEAVPTSPAGWRWLRFTACLERHSRVTAELAATGWQAA